MNAALSCKSQIFSGMPRLRRPGHATYHHPTTRRIRECTLEGCKLAGTTRERPGAPGVPARHASLLSWAPSPRMVKLVRAARELVGRRHACAPLFGEASG